MVVVMAMLGEGDGAAADLSFSAINVVKLRYAQGASTITQQVAKNLFC